MPKQKIPVRQNLATVIGGPRHTGQLDLGAATAGLPEIPNFNGAAVVVQLRNLNEQAERVLAGAQRADISDEKSAKVGTDFLSSITSRINEVDTERKGVTGGYDKLVKGLNALFSTGPTAKLAEAKSIMQRKLQVYVAAERRKAEEAAAAERERLAAEATAQAQVAMDEGDDDGALEILQSAAAVEVVAEKAVVRGKSGATLSTTRRKVGKITDLRKFIAWVAAHDTPGALAVLGGIEVGQRELNQLAANVFAIREATGGDHEVPGFVAGYEESIGAR